MSWDRRWGARLALGWIAALTRTAEAGTRRDRRDEIASDVFEQLAHSGGTGSSAVAVRTLSGIPADLAWRLGVELRHTRWAWHLRNPSTAITSAMVVMVPVNFVADLRISERASSDRSWFLTAAEAPLWCATLGLGTAILVFGTAALVARLRGSTAERYRPRSALEAARRRVTAALGLALAGSALFRFGALTLVGAFCWFAFIGLVAIYLALLALGALSPLLTLGRYLPKVGT